MKDKGIAAEEFDRIFDDGKQDIVQYLDLSTARHQSSGTKRINVDFPEWMVVSLDKEAQHLGVSRQSVIKTWIEDRLDRRVS
jgi:hypothetical protein